MAHAPDLSHGRATKLKLCHRCCYSAFGEHSSMFPAGQKKHSHNALRRVHVRRGRLSRHRGSCRFKNER
uniref:Uncharacterized protein n=1 Tax=Hyaloperonospora arabidopsidis (strain Emoy2) TaxID=559515 RepID=M4BLZ8_HYAAE